VTRLDLIVLAGKRLRDTAHTHYTEDFLGTAINQGIDRIRQEISVLRGMEYIYLDGDIPALLPVYYHEILSIYAQMRALEMDEKLYESRIANNEFEVKLASLLAAIEMGEIVIVDDEGTAVPYSFTHDQVQDTYFQGIPYDTTADGRYTNDRDEYEEAGDGETVPG